MVRKLVGGESLEATSEQEEVVATVHWTGITTHPVLWPVRVVNQAKALVAVEDHPKPVLL
ncbi:hypothetical protein V2J09_013110 [Rumex salicifolius]